MQPDVNIPALVSEKINNFRIALCRISLLPNSGRIVCSLPSLQIQVIIQPPNTAQSNALLSVAFPSCFQQS